MALEESDVATYRIRRAALAKAEGIIVMALAQDAPTHDAPVGDTVATLTCGVRAVYLRTANGWTLVEWTLP